VRLAALFVILSSGCANADAAVVDPMPNADLPELFLSAVASATATPPVEVEPVAVADRLYSKVRFLWIRPRPDLNTKWIGYLSLGDSVAVKREIGPVHSDGCARWYEIEPRGFVCAGDHSTLDADDRDVRELRKAAARRDTAWPYSYGKSTGTTVYLNVPPKRRQRFREAGLEGHLERAAKVRAGEGAASVDPLFVGVDLDVTGNPPPAALLHLGPRSRTNKKRIARGSTLAYAYDFDADGRSWVMTWDRAIVPKDRVVVYPRSSFRGVVLDDALSLPIAFTRSRQPKFRQTANGVEASGHHWERYATIPLSNDELEHDGQRYLVAKDGSLVSTSDISVPRLRTTIPPRPDGGRRTWIDVSVLRGWLVAYEGERPVFATMISPGRGGVPKEGVPPLETAATPIGRFSVNAKFLTATMVSQEHASVVHSEVPYTQNFTGPYAIHAAYWHDDWGVGKSGGCVNLSPLDAQHLFEWTEPQLPPGWHGVRQASERSTLVSLHK
jgi:hypothetical protein